MNSAPLMDAWHAAGLFDAVCVAVLLLSLMMGLMRGLVGELASLLTWAGALFFAWWATPAVVQWLGGVPAVQAWGLQARQILAFVLAFVLAMLLLALVVRALRGTLSAVGLGMVDGILGGAYGVARAVVLLWVATLVIVSTPLQTNTWWHDSPAAGWLVQSLRQVAPSLPQSVRQWLPPELNGSTA